MLLCSARDISAICSIPTKNITMRLARTYRCTRTRRSRALSRLSVARWRCQFWADCTTNISGPKFPTGTTQNSAVTPSRGCRNNAGTLHCEGSVSQKNTPSSSALEDRDRGYELRAQQSLTAAFFANQNLSSWHENPNTLRRAAFNWLATPPAYNHSIPIELRGRGDRLGP